MKKLKIVFVLSICLIICYSCIAFAKNEGTIKNNQTTEEKILSCYELKLDDINESEEKILELNVEIPEISEDSINLLKFLNKNEYCNENAKEIQKIYNSTIDKTLIRAMFDSYEIDIDSLGEIVKYKNFENYSNVDVDKRDYKEDELLPEVDYLIKEKKDLDEIIKNIELINKLDEYKLTDCSNNIDGCWIISWCKDCGNNLINNYDSVNIAIDAIDGSVMQFMKNKAEPNTYIPKISEIEAIAAAKDIISKVGEDVIETNLGFTKPNFYWNSGGPYEKYNSVRLTWIIKLTYNTVIYVDAVTGEILGGDQTLSSDYGRSLQVVSGYGRSEKVQLASNGLSRLGYNQTGYAPVDWNVAQGDIDYLFSASNLYGLYLCSHGIDLGNEHIISDTSNIWTNTWSRSSNQSNGNWHFVFLDSCYSNAGDRWASSLNIIGYTGRCFIGWHGILYQEVSYHFNVRLWPALGYQTPVRDVVVDSLMACRTYDGCPDCNPAFHGDVNYMGWAW